jgi:hypothetical protein
MQSIVFPAFLFRTPPRVTTSRCTKLVLRLSWHRATEQYVSSLVVFYIRLPCSVACLAQIFASAACQSRALSEASSKSGHKVSTK